MTADDRRALAAGLPAGLLLVLIRARRIWSDHDEPGEPAGLNFAMPDGWWQDDALRAAVTHPAAAGWDGIFIAAMRRALR